MTCCPISVIVSKVITWNYNIDNTLSAMTMRTTLLSQAQFITSKGGTAT